MDDLLTHRERSQPQETKLMRKGHGRIIHVSDFVEEEFGRLVVHDQEGAIVKDARCITYPGANGDPWWEHNQLLAQVDKAISIFEELHPGCVALFIFDPSAKINISYSILFNLTTSYSSYFGCKKGISRNKTSFFLLMNWSKGKLQGGTVSLQSTKFRYLRRLFKQA